ncbi:MAG: 2OG-Fe(II) oxygenase [Sphingomonadaceae bacterium]|uniref:2OG-Fe(II) oxygenase n=1 Tax=Thermaurantiacus sp. TaxID=2820283 RepID=UPI00298EF55A|nr:2OG-Fe(II) oxygenase [Thermaurantiacus sp.]MCS6987255.1 2OG-Fe(II) oxygenase [Sphingomonadaceae bacterium]MDW8414475.1 2OG-Fe(II) oxygenase [Thermaurantiacus sp.]
MLQVSERLLRISREDVVAEPFPHVVTDALLPDDLFRRLKSDWPDAHDFERTAAETGGVGSRAGKATGFDIYRGDPAYEALIARSSAWAEFDGFINSPAFVATYLEVFGPDRETIGLKATIDPAHYRRDVIEPREVLKEHKSLGERVFEAARRWAGPRRHRGPVELFTRLDITRSVSGYAKPPHCDRGNRLCSLIVYFSDAEATGLEGGELLIFRAKAPQPVERSPRHPRPDEVEVVATLKPKENRGVFFPCCNTSYHGVTAITSQGVPRDFLYINISAVDAELW